MPILMAKTTHQQPGKKDARMSSKSTRATPRETTTDRLDLQSVARGF